MGFKRRSKSQLALTLLDTQAGQQLVQERLSDIDSELTELERSRKQLEAEKAQLAPLIRSGGNRGRRGQNGTSARRSISTGRVLEALEALGATKEPSTKADIAGQLNANPARLKKPLDALVDEGLVKRVGRGRGTRYRPA